MSKPSKQFPTGTMYPWQSRNVAPLRLLRTHKQTPEIWREQVPWRLKPQQFSKTRCTEFQSRNLPRVRPCSNGQFRHVRATPKQALSPSSRSSRTIIKSLLSLFTMVKIAQAEIRSELAGWADFSFCR